MIPLSTRITSAEQELADLLAFPPEKLAAIIRKVGFRCTGCSRCCTREFNGHVFLLDEDTAAAREIDPGSIEPAPDPEFCDQNGIFYVSGFSLRARDDERGSCCFLVNGRCRIYAKRFAICRIYPYMLHREADDEGNTDWRQIAGLDQHGEYHTEIPESTCAEAATETQNYEIARVRQEIAFLTGIREYFSHRHLRHVQKVYDDRMRAFHRGEEIRVMVFFRGRFEEHRVRGRKDR